MEPLRKPLFHRFIIIIIIIIIIFTFIYINIYTLITTIFQENILNICTVSKWRPNNRFSFCVISILAKIWKTTFPKKFVNEIWLKLGDHKYINIAEIKFE